MAGVSFSSFAGQNWLITPAALAVNEAKPATIADQRWFIQFSGVGILDLQGNNFDDWRREVLVIFPDVDAPLQFAISRHGIPVPTSSFGRVSPAIVVEQRCRMQRSALLLSRILGPLGLRSRTPISASR